MRAGWLLLGLVVGCGPASTGTIREAPPSDDAPDEAVDTEPAPSDASDGGADTEPEAPVFSSAVRPLDAVARAAMQGVTMHAGCPVGFGDLRFLDVAHHTFDRGVVTGTLVVHKDAVDDLQSVFAALFAAGFPIERMEPVVAYGGSDDASMAANNSSAFNCRAITGGGGWSQHSYGDAIDLNPLRNPYVRGSTVLPPEGASWTARDGRPGVIVEGDAVTAAFDAIGWSWGGRWSSLKDYQHFSSNGR